MAIEEEILIQSVKEFFKSKGEKIIDMNIEAFRLGKEAAGI